MRVITAFRTCDGTIGIMTDQSIMHPIGLPYIVKKEDPIFFDVSAYLAEHPEALVPEPKPPEPTSEQKAAAIRAQRNALLAQSDWTSLVDCQLAEADYNRWRIYRQALRDITDQAGFPDSVVWPEAPK